MKHMTKTQQHSAAQPSTAQRSLPNWAVMFGHKILTAVPDFWTVRVAVHEKVTFGLLSQARFSE